MGSVLLAATPRIKICGITNVEDALAAVEAGADALGFVFHRESPRCVVLEVVRRIVARLPPFVLPVGVFVNEDLKTVRDQMDECGLALAQLHGDESTAYCEALGRPILKGIRLRDKGSLLALIQTVRPYGVDVSSGVEVRPGKKDQAKIQAFIRAAKLASAQSGVYTA